MRHGSALLHMVSNYNMERLRSATGPRPTVAAIVVARFEITVSFATIESLDTRHSLRNFRRKIVVQSMPSLFTSLAYSVASSLTLETPCLALPSSDNPVLFQIAAKVGFASN
jgi:hypothetical protein